MRLTNLLSSLNPFAKTRKRNKSKRNKIQRKSKIQKKLRHTKRRFKMRGGWGGSVPASPPILDNPIMKGGWGGVSATPI